MDAVVQYKKANTETTVSTHSEVTASASLWRDVRSQRGEFVYKYGPMSRRKNKVCSGNFLFFFIFFCKILMPLNVTHQLPCLDNIFPFF